MPAEQQFIQFLGNPVVAAATNALFNTLLVPRFTMMLTGIKFAIKDFSTAPANLMVDIHKTQVTTSLTFQMHSVIVAPMLRWGAHILLSADSDDRCVKHFNFG